MGKKRNEKAHVKHLPSPPRQSIRRYDASALNINGSATVWMGTAVFGVRVRTTSESLLLYVFFLLGLVVTLFAQPI